TRARLRLARRMTVWLAFPVAGVPVRESKDPYRVRRLQGGARLGFRLERLPVRTRCLHRPHALGRIPPRPLPLDSRLPALAALRAAVRAYVGQRPDHVNAI